MTDIKPSSTTVLLIELNVSWIYFKSLKFYEMYKNPEKYFPEFNFNGNLKGEIKGNLKIELVTLAVQCAEIFGIYMMCFHQRRKNFYKKILDYSVSDVVCFYKNIEKKKISYIRRMLVYPSYNQVGDKNMTNKLNESSKNVKQKLIKISNFYDKYRFVYNSYKHGLRVFPVFGADFMPLALVSEILPGMNAGASIYPQLATDRMDI